MGEIILDVRHLEKTFGDHQVLRDISFSVNEGDVTCIIGASAPAAHFAAPETFAATPIEAAPVIKNRMGKLTVFSRVPSISSIPGKNSTIALIMNSWETGI